MKIAAWNVNSVRARLDRLVDWLKSAQPDVLCLQELKCADGEFPMEAVREAGYHAVTHGQKTYNGVAILAKTEPTDVVMDGWEGMGVFRPHAFHYFFLHEEVRAWLPRTPVDAFLGELEAGSVRPKLIAMDENLRALGPRFASFVETHYTSSDGFFYFPNEKTGPSP